MMASASSAATSDLSRPLLHERIVLAADARRGHADYTRDVIWALYAAPGPDGGLRIETSAGVQVQHLRLFPWVEHAGQRLQDPAAWSEPPVLADLGPDYALVTARPLPDVQLQVWFWVARSRVLWMRFRWLNQGVRPLPWRWALAADLQPLVPADQPFEPLVRGGVHVLVARVGQGHPLLFLTGGPQAVLSPYPALTLDAPLLPDEPRGFSAVLAWEDDPEDGLTTARHWAARPWEAVTAHLRLEAERAPQLRVPRRAEATWWALRGRQTALRLLHGPTAHLPYPFPVRAREPDHGFSRAGTGADHPFAWSGLTVAEAWYAAVAYWLWAAPSVVAGWVENFVHTQQEPGQLDGHPGLGGQRGRFLASPLLVDLAWRVFQRTQDVDFLARVFPALRALVDRWLEAEHDADGDGWPEWQHHLQLGLAEFPLSAAWHLASPGLDLRTLETPAAAAYLYRALAALEDLAPALQQSPDPLWSTQRAALQEALLTTWDATRGYPHHRDRDTHRYPTGRLWARGRGPGRWPVEAVLDPPARAVVHIQSIAGTPRAARVTLRGRDHQGRRVTMTLGPGDWRWYEGRGVATAPRPLRDLDAVDIEGLMPMDRWRVFTPDLHTGDITLLLPLWAEMLPPEQAEHMVQRAIVTPRRFGQAWGLPIVPGQRQDIPPAWRLVSLLWNVHAVEGMWQYGYRDQAVALLYRLTKSQMRALAREGALVESVDARTGAAGPGRDTILALPPLGTVLRVAELDLSPRRIQVRGPSHWPDALEVQGWGWRLTRAPDGLSLHGPGDAQVRLPADAVGELLWERGTWIWEPATPEVREPATE